MEVFLLQNGIKETQVRKNKPLQCSCSAVETLWFKHEAISVQTRMTPELRSLDACSSISSKGYNKRQMPLFLCLYAFVCVYIN